MTLTTRRRLTLGATLGFLHWFFGNFYEAVVFSPNWVLDSPAQLTRLNELFVRTRPSLYFVPVIVAATLLLWALTLSNPHAKLTPSYRNASLFALLNVLRMALVATTAVHSFAAYRKLDALRCQRAISSPSHRSLGSRDS